MLSHTVAGRVHDSILAFIQGRHISCSSKVEVLLGFQKFTHEYRSVAFVPKKTLERLQRVVANTSRKNGFGVSLPFRLAFDFRNQQEICNVQLLPLHRQVPVELEAGSVRTPGSCSRLGSSTKP